MHLRPALLACACLLLAACGSPAAPSPAHSATARPSPTATPAPVPDTLQVTVVTSGAGVYQLATIPVAILHNDAAHHGAAGVVVHFTTVTSAGRTVYSLDSVPVNIGPGETLPVAADCTDGCVGASTATATVTVGAWVSTPGVSPQPGTATYTCGTCRGGNGYGTVTGSLSAHIGAGAAVAVFADCEDATGAVVAGGVRELVWPGGTALPLEVPVIVDRPPAVCHIGGSTGW